MLTETLRQACEHELSLEERRVKLEEAHLEFEQEKWRASQRKTYVEAVYKQDEEVDVEYHHNHTLIPVILRLYNPRLHQRNPSTDLFQKGPMHGAVSPGRCTVFRMPMNTSETYENGKCSEHKQLRLQHLDLTCHLCRVFTTKTSPILPIFLHTMTPNLACMCSDISFTQLLYIFIQITSHVMILTKIRRTANKTAALISIFRCMKNLSKK